MPTKKLRPSLVKLAQALTHHLLALAADPANLSGAGFHFGYFDDMHMVNTSAAHRLLAWADAQGPKDSLKMALFSAYFSERKDVSDPEIFADAATSVGLDRAEASAALVDGRYAEGVLTVERMWAENGDRGVPATVFERRHLVTGAQGVDKYAAILCQLSGRDAA